MSRKWFGFKRPYSKRSFHRYEPFYDNHADYNTNAKSYYDYLARFNKHIRVITEFVNRLLNRNITFTNTDSVDFTKKGDWIDNGECEPDNYNDEIEISAVVNISDSTETRTMLNTDLKTFTIPNGSMIKNNGLWSPDYIQMINEIDKEIGNIQGDINDLDNRVTINEGDITNINNRIDSMLGINFTTLTKGTDYNLTFYNECYTGATDDSIITNDLIVRMIETDNTIDFIITSSTGTSTLLRNDDATNNIEMRHSLSVEDVPKSRIFKLTLLGQYAQYNNRALLRSITNNNLWNMRPVTARASWNAHMGISRVSDGYLFAWTSFNDGYNSQLDRYNEDLSLHHGNINIDMTIQK